MTEPKFDPKVMQKYEIKFGHEAMMLTPTEFRVLMHKLIKNDLGYESGNRNVITDYEFYEGCSTLVMRLVAYFEAVNRYEDSQIDDGLKVIPRDQWLSEQEPPL